MINFYKILILQKPVFGGRWWLIGLTGGMGK